MSEEIKEILDLLNFNKDTISNGTCRVEDFISREQIIKLLDYITNLQQENEFLKLNNPEMNIEHFRIVKENKRKIDNLREENKILRKNAEHNDKVVDKARWNEMIYKSRCEKAIEYIMSNLITEWDIKNDGCVSGSDLPANAITPILNILQGSDENE